MIKYSIIIAVFNGEKTIDNAIDSILTQTYGDYELIVINDASTDATALKLHKYIGLPNVTVLTNKINMERSASRNKGISVAKGEFITFLDADDIYINNRLELLEELTQDCDFLYHPYYLESLGSKRIYNTKSVILEELLARNTIGLQSVVIRRLFLLDHDLKFDVNLNSSEDYDLWLRCIHGGISVFCPTPLSVVTKDKSKELKDYSLRTSTHAYVKLRFIIQNGLELKMKYFIFDLARLLFRKVIISYRFRSLKS